jgi:heterodisulfide reductase subunit A-like polyferredoxin
VGSAVEGCGKIDNNVLESTKTPNLFCVSWRKNNYLSVEKTWLWRIDKAVQTAGGGSAGLAAAVQAATAGLDVFLL